MCNQTVIILEGADSVGKSVIKKALEKKSNWKYIVLDRFTGSDIVYDKIFGRKDRDNILLDFELGLKNICNVKLVYLTADTNILIKRIKERGEKVDEKFLNKSKELFENDYLEKTNLDFIIVDTGKLNVNKCVDKIINFMEKK